MTVTADHIRTTVTAYLDAHPEEGPDFAPVIGLLDTGGDLASRTEFRGHADIAPPPERSMSEVLCTGDQRIRG